MSRDADPSHLHIVNQVGFFTSASADTSSSLTDWYRSFTVADPTAPNKPVEVQWYAKAGTGVPAPQHGDVLVARNLVVCLARSSFALVSCSSVSVYS